jgi:hypothetical protein
MIPAARHGGRKRLVNVRELLNGIFCVQWTGCQWSAIGVNPRLCLAGGPWLPSCGTLRHEIPVGDDYRCGLRFLMHWLRIGPCDAARFVSERDHHDVLEGSCDSPLYPASRAGVSERGAAALHVPRESSFCVDIDYQAC